LFPICLQFVQTTVNVGKTLSVFVIIAVIHLDVTVLNQHDTVGFKSPYGICAEDLWVFADLFLLLTF
jgi:hypothetical protein